MIVTILLALLGLLLGLALGALHGAIERARMLERLLATGSPTAAPTAVRIPPPPDAESVLTSRDMIEAARSIAPAVDAGTVDKSRSVLAASIHRRAAEKGRPISQVEADAHAAELMTLAGG